MRVVQTLWACGQSLKNNSFGWPSPQYHIISWALSSLMLREHYEDIHLYTDSSGYELLIDKLKLPYKTGNIVYDQIDQKHIHNYALAKLMTYNVQPLPFIHVDGDVFIFRKFKNGLEKAALIAQNPEKGTAHYEALMKATKRRIKYLPHNLEQELAKPSISAFNAGIFGGHDLAFIKKYANYGLELFERNTGFTEDEHRYGNINILFEQILFYVMCTAENKTVTCLFDDAINDNGYSKAKFADFSLTPTHLDYLHLIGGKKKKREICDLMSKTLFQKYPETFHQVIAYFNQLPVYYSGKILKPLNGNSELKAKTKPGNLITNSFKYTRTIDLLGELNFSVHELTQDDIEAYVHYASSAIARDVFNYERLLRSTLQKWENIDVEYLLMTERCSPSALEDLLNSSHSREDIHFQRNRYLTIIEESFDWTWECKKHIAPDLFVSQSEDESGIAIIPQLFFEGYYEVTIDVLDYNILMLLGGPKNIEELQATLANSFNITDEVGLQQLRNLILLKLKALYLNRCLFFETNVAVDIQGVI
jgi:hypothetical protein